MHRHESNYKDLSTQGPSVLLASCPFQSPAALPGTRRGWPRSGQRCPYGMEAPDFGCPPLVPPDRAPQLLLRGCSPRKPSSSLGSCVHPWASGGLAHVRLRSICPLQAGAFAFQSLPVLRGAQFYILLCSETLSPRGSDLVHHRSVPRFFSLLGRKTKGVLPARSSTAQKDSARLCSRRAEARPATIPAGRRL